MSEPTLLQAYSVVLWLLLLSGHIFCLNFPFLAVLQGPEATLELEAAIHITVVEKALSFHSLHSVAF